MDTATQKQMMRLALHKRLQSFTLSHISDQEEGIARRVLSAPEVQKAQSFFIYVSHGKEVPTWKLVSCLLSHGKTIYVPKVIDESQMVAVRITSMQQLAQGKYGLWEPPLHVSETSVIDINFIPGVAFDKRYHRLGRGGGYYDRFLAHHACQKNIGLAWQQQIMDKVPVEKHDVMVDDLYIFPYTGSPQFFSQKKD